MKNKILNIIIYIGLGALIALFVLLFCNIIDVYSLGFTYAFLGSLLFIFGGLNFKFRKYTELEETISCLRMTRRAIASIKADKDLSYVKRKAILNQITNCLLIMEDLITQHEYYTLKDNLAQLQAIQAKYNEDFPVKIRLDKEKLSAELKVFDETISELKSFC